MLEVSGLRIRYYGRPVINGITFTLRPCLAALIGPNGSGKTTLLKAIAGIIDYEGVVRIEGTDIRRMDPYEKASHVTYVPPTIAALPDMSVGDLLLTGPNLSFERLEYYIDLLGLRNLLYRRLWEVSSGELQRALIARGLARDSVVYLIDEPLSYTDMRYQLVIMKHLKHLVKQGKLIIVASNQLNPLLNYVDHILALKDGRLFINASLDKGLDEAALSELYGVKVRIIRSEDFVDAIPVG